MIKTLKDPIQPLHDRVSFSERNSFILIQAKTERSRSIRMINAEPGIVTEYTSEPLDLVPSRMNLSPLSSLCC
ncbi:hypothetical protein ElyMa_004822300 [Elysia marginata]|uniref:Uncharacterized protein n=1 Tax=Elysia marginata TaxID=1093978 RepID=A0AAV4IKR7_9GAST|nr:hypothetical protein ElyMa_004822300 [Elysia marginata]